MKKKKTMTKWERLKECKELINFHTDAIETIREYFNRYEAYHIEKRRRLKILYHEQRLNELDLELKDLYSYYVVYGEWWMKEHLAFPKLWGMEDL